MPSHQSSKQNITGWNDDALSRGMDTMFEDGTPKGCSSEVLGRLLWECNGLPITGYPILGLHNMRKICNM